MWIAPLPRHVLPTTVHASPTCQHVRVIMLWLPLQIEETMDVVRREMALLTEVDQPGSMIDKCVACPSLLTHYSHPYLICCRSITALWLQCLGMHVASVLGDACVPSPNQCLMHPSRLMEIT